MILMRPMMENVISNRRSNEVWLLGFFFLIPLVPSPAIAGVVGKLFGIFCFLLITIPVMLEILLKQKKIYKQVAIVFFVYSIIHLFYLLRVVYQGEMQEYSYVASRFVSLLILLSILYCFLSDRRYELFKQYFFYGFIALSCLIIVTGVTGIDLISEVRASRSIVIDIPFYKTVGVNRSFGEYGIYASIAWAYLLVYGGTYRRSVKYLFGSLIMLGIVISQSRSTYLSVALITIVYVLTTHRQINIPKVLFLLLAYLIPFLLVLISSADFSMFEAMKGEGIYEKNVDQRFVMMSFALSYFSWENIFGISHADWGHAFYLFNDSEEGLHNHFLSNMIFMGVFGLIYNLLIIYISATFVLKKRKTWCKDETYVFLALVGSVVSLQFYEGFFSPVLMILFALVLKQLKKNNKGQSYNYVS